MPTPLVTFRNRSTASVEFGHNFHKGGPIHRFELNVTHQGLQESRLMRIDGDNYKVTIDLNKFADEAAWLPDCVNESVTTLYNFSVRAVTIDEDGKTYIGDWSQPEVTPGYCTGKLHLINIFDSREKVKSGFNSREMECSEFFLTFLK